MNQSEELFFNSRIVECANRVRDIKTKMLIMRACLAILLSCALTDFADFNQITNWHLTVSVFGAGFCVASFVYSLINFYVMKSYLSLEQETLKLYEDGKKKAEIAEVKRNGFKIVK